MPAFNDLIQQSIPALLAQYARVLKTILNFRRDSLGDDLVQYETEIGAITKMPQSRGYDLEPFATEEQMWLGIHRFLDGVDEFKRKANTIELTADEQNKYDERCNNFRVMFKKFKFNTENDKAAFYAERILRKVQTLQGLLIAEPSIEVKLKYLFQIERWGAILNGKQCDEHSEILEKADGKYFKNKSDLRIQGMRAQVQAISSETSAELSRMMNVDSNNFISTPGSLDERLIHQTPFGAGTCDLLGARSEQEDTLVVSRLRSSDLADLSAQDLGHRLWTALKEIDEQVTADSSLDHQGATASTTIIRGDDIITATIGDSVSFAIFYDAVGNPFVYRLNHRIHSADEPTELARLRALGLEPVQCDDEENAYPLGVKVSVPTEVRLPSGINMARSVGDNTSRPYGAVSDADIDVHSLSQLKSSAKASPGFTGEVSKVQIMSACDGFTCIADKVSKGKDGAFHQAKQEEFLKYCLNYDKDLRAVDLSESALAERCASLCLEPPHVKKKKPTDKDAYLEEFRAGGMIVESNDNISVAIQTVPLEQSLDDPFAVMLGVYDGHGGNVVSRMLAANIQTKFTHQCGLSLKEYAAQSLSVYSRGDDYSRDNEKLTSPEVKQLETYIRQMAVKLKEMKRILESDEPLPADFNYLKRMEECRALLESIYSFEARFSEIKGFREAMVQRPFEKQLNMVIPYLMERKKASVATPVSAPVVEVAASPSRPEPGVSSASIFRSPEIENARKKELYTKVDRCISDLYHHVKVARARMPKSPTEEQVKEAKALSSVATKISALRFFSTNNKTKSLEEYTRALVDFVNHDDNRIEHKSVIKLYEWIRAECRKAHMPEEAASPTRHAP